MGPAGGPGPRSLGFIGSKRLAGLGVEGEQRIQLHMRGGVPPIEPGGRSPGFVGSERLAGLDYRGRSGNTIAFERQLSANRARALKPWRASSAASPWRGWIPEGIEHRVQLKKSGRHPCGQQSVALCQGLAASAGGGVITSEKVPAESVREANGQMGNPGAFCNGRIENCKLAEHS